MDLLKFLFNESQELDRREDQMEEDLEAIFDAVSKDLAGQKPVAAELDAKKTPLAKALKDLGFENTSLELDPRGLCWYTDDPQEYSAASDLLSTPDAIHKLAELGWVACRIEDSAQAAEPPEYRIRFLEVTQVETEGNSGDKPEDMENVIKKAREFFSTPMPRESGFKKPSGSGVGDVKDGDKAETAKKPKESSKK